LAASTLPPITAEAAFVRHIDPSLASINPAPLVGKHPGLVHLAARTKRDG
jgi:hypothetical protein